MTIGPIDKFLKKSKPTTEGASSKGGAGKYPLTKTVETTVLHKVSDRNNTRNFREDVLAGNIAKDARTVANSGRHTEDGEPNRTESPNKKARISSYQLRIHSRYTEIRHIGDILALTDVVEGEVIPGGPKEVSLKCVVTENLRGRNGADKEERKLFRFIYLADFTGYINIGMFPKETGLMNYDVPEQDCDYTTKCSFCAHVQGFVSWKPSYKDPTTPTYFFSVPRGSTLQGIHKIHDFDWHGENRLMFPTSDVCLQLVNSKFAYCAKFSTTGVCGKVETVNTNVNGVLLLSLRDPVGCVAVELILDKEEETAESFMESKMIEEGQFVFIRGILDMHTPSGVYATLEGKSSLAEIQLVQKEKYDEYVRLLMRTEKDVFPGNPPERM